MTLTTPRMGSSMLLNLLKFMQVHVCSFLDEIDLQLFLRSLERRFNECIGSCSHIVNGNRLGCNMYIKVFLAFQKNAQIAQVNLPRLCSRNRF